MLSFDIVSNGCVSMMFANRVEQQFVVDVSGVSMMGTDCSIVCIDVLAEHKVMNEFHVLVFVVEDDEIPLNSCLLFEQARYLTDSMNLSMDK